VIGLDTLIYNAYPSALMENAMIPVHTARNGVSILKQLS